LLGYPICACPVRGRPLGFSQLALVHSSEDTAFGLTVEYES